MKPLLSLILSVFLIGSAFYSCKRENNTGPAQKRIVDLIAGTGVWHGTLLFDTTLSILNNDTVSITAVNDSTIEFSDYRNTNISLTYFSTDSARGCITFLLKGAPPVLYYYYNGDSLHYMSHTQGVHLDYQDVYYP